METVRVIRTVREMHRVADRMRENGFRIGLVPTMGYLHGGHASLIRQIGRVTDRTVVSVFVNPAQFGPGEDFETYPRDFERDKAIVQAGGGTLVYAPSTSEMYPDGYATYLEVERLADHLCGASRPGHFRGVATVVTKLFAAVKPHVTILGQKDAQQAGIVRRLVRDLNLDVDILIAPTVREVDGLAKSSRNRYLTPCQRRRATVIYTALQEGRELVLNGERRASVVIDAMNRRVRRCPDLGVDYIAAVDAENFRPVEAFGARVLLAAAVRCGQSRLIDNIVVETEGQPVQELR
ncbi:MAG: pantoate--beta-alanine ligase [Gemmatimonadetes bacterium]|nr:pantoate--beta-alanine ligase [Gemmatimonadota bacterium]MDE3256498.1 pantoate--beta-alanine ligase [Gemmatimonadota bacterium]